MFVQHVQKTSSSALTVDVSAHLGSVTATMIVEICPMNRTAVSYVYGRPAATLAGRCHSVLRLMFFLSFFFAAIISESIGRSSPDLPHVRC